MSQNVTKSGEPFKAYTYYFAEVPLDEYDESVDFIPVGYPDEAEVVICKSNLVQTKTSEQQEEFIWHLENCGQCFWDESEVKEKYPSLEKTKTVETEDGTKEEPRLSPAGWA